MQGRLRGYRWVVGAGNHGCWLGSYEQEKQAMFVANIGVGAVVYDIGANVGFYSLLAAELVGETGRVIAFEPLARNLELLRVHVRINDLKQVEVIDAAVSDRAGEAAFDNQTNASMGQLNSAGQLKVRTVSLDDLTARGTLPLPDVLKIDVEGAEMAVLEGAKETLEKCHPMIFLATHGAREKELCCERLQSHGYSIAPLGNGTFNDADEFLAHVKVER
jgi:FkbM family methyltransferase